MKIAQGGHTYAEDLTLPLGNETAGSRCNAQEVSSKTVNVSQDIYGEAISEHVLIDSSWRLIIYPNVR